MRWIGPCLMTLALTFAACSDNDSDASAMKSADTGEPAGGSGGKPSLAGAGGNQTKPAAEGGSQAQTAANSGADLAALRASGIDKYLGAAKPTAEEPGGGEGETVYRFAVEDGPRCLRGDPYSMSVRKKSEDDVLIYLQGGGSCSSAICSANMTAEPRISSAGLFSPDESPVSSWSVVYVPYCDGSLHYGDKEHLDESPVRYHHGLRNLSAALDVAVAKFPSAKRILLAGSSAGGLGTIYATALVRVLYPKAQLFVWNDAGLGVSTPDGTRAKLTREEWGTRDLIPKSCAECRESPHSTPVITWNLEQDKGLKVAIFSAYEDTVIADTFLMIGGPAFKQAMLDETGKITKAQPERAKRFYIEGTQHTTASNLMRTQVNGVSIGEWLGFMLAGDARWTDTLQ
jgi:hypothetical protein